MTVLRRLQLFPRRCYENSRSCSVSRDNLTDLPLFLTGDLSRPGKTTAAHLHSRVSRKNPNNGSDVREVINSGSARCDVVLVLPFHMTKCTNWREMKAALQFQSFSFHNTTALTTFSGIWRRVKTSKHSLQGFTRFHLSSPVSAVRMNFDTSRKTNLYVLVWRHHSASFLWFWPQLCASLTLFGMTALPATNTNYHLTFVMFSHRPKIPNILFTLRKSS